MVCKKVIIFLSILFFSTYLFAEEIKDYTIIEKRLSQLEKGLNSPGHKFHDFEEVKRIWRQVVDNTPSVLAKGEEQGAQNFRESFYKHLEILLWSSQVRSDYLQKIHNGESGTIFELSLPFFDDLGRELKLVPLKWYAIGYLKVQYIKKKLEGGFDGIKILVYDLCIFAIVLFIPVFFWRISKKILASIQKVRTKLLRKSYHRRSFSLYAELLKYIIDYLPWFVALYSLSLASELLHSSNFSELSIFVPFVTYFIWFKISQKVFSDALLKVAKYKKGSDVSLIKEKASRNASQVSFVVFISFSLIYAIESVVSKGLSFYIVNYISTAVITFVLFLTARDWKEEIAQKVSDYDIPHVSSWLEKSLLRKTWFFLCLPVLVIIISVNIITAALMFNVKAYVFDVHFEKDFSTDIVTRAYQVFQKLEVKRPQIYGSAFS